MQRRRSVPHTFEEKGVLSRIYPFPIKRNKLHS